MDPELRAQVFLENFYRGGSLVGKFQATRQDTGGPLAQLVVGVVGAGTEGREGESEPPVLRSVWVNGNLLSPLYIANDHSGSKTHIEGIATKDGKVRLVEFPYDFPAHDGNCTEYELRARRPFSTQGAQNFTGDVFRRFREQGFERKMVGKIALRFDPYWTRVEGDSTQTLVRSNPLAEKDLGLTRLVTPNFWEDFLRGIEEEGHEHPYQKVNQR